MVVVVVVVNKNHIQAKYGISSPFAQLLVIKLAQDKKKASKYIKRWPENVDNFLLSLFFLDGCYYKIKWFKVIISISSTKRSWFPLCNKNSASQYKQTKITSRADSLTFSQASKKDEEQKKIDNKYIQNKYRNIFPMISDHMHRGKKKRKEKRPTKIGVST